MKNLKYIIIVGILPFIISSCVSYRIQSAGDLTSASTRNIEQANDYLLLKTYAGISKTDIEAAKSSHKKGIIKRSNPIVKEINAYKADNLQAAIDNVVKSVPGGEYLKNLRVYVLFSGVSFRINGMRKDIAIDYIATGDVWGMKTDNPEIKGFHKDDNVVFQHTKDLRKIIGKKNFGGEVNKQYNGKILVLKGGSATIQLENGAVIDIPYSYLTNLGQ